MEWEASLEGPLPLLVGGSRGLGRVLCVFLRRLPILGLLVGELLRIPQLFQLRLLFVELLLHLALGLLLFMDISVCGALGVGALGVDGALGVSALGVGDT